MTRRILITGGAGFIGGALAARLAGEDDSEIHLLDDFRRGRDDELVESLRRRPNVRLLAADASDAATYQRLPMGFEEVYHLAAVIGVRHVLERPEEVLRVNIGSTLHLLDWVARGGARRLLFSSTSEVYGWTQTFHSLPIPTPEDVPLALTDLANPRSSYAGSKIAGELLVRQYGVRHRFPFAIVRYHNVYGPRMGNEHVIPELYGRARRGQNPLVVYSADHSRAFCYVSDAVEATVRALRVPAASGRTINVGNDREEVTIGELARRLLRVAGIDASIEPRAAANDPIRRRCPDISLARTLLDFEPRVGLDAGLRETLAWYASAPAPEVRA
jgi:UDP-glucose 4-epimerase/UDP-glucuronate decarboxylase